MSFEDKSITCSDCGTTFNFSSGDKSSSNLKASPTSLNVVPHAAEPTKHGALTVAAIATHHGIKASAYYTQRRTQNEVSLEEQAA